MYNIYVFVDIYVGQVRASLASSISINAAWLLVAACLQLDNLFRLLYFSVFQF